MKRRKHMSLKQRLIMMLLLSAVIAGSYKLVQWITYLYLEPISLETAVDHQIPFFPPIFIIYLSVYLILPVLFYLVRKKGHVMKICFTFLLTSMIHYVFYILLPVKYILRPTLEMHWNDIMGSLISLFYYIDSPVNCFPSMHVSFAFLSYFCIRRFRPQLAHLFLLLAIAISASTLLVKQHYLVDVAAGMGLALVVNRVYIRRRIGAKGRS